MFKLDLRTRRCLHSSRRNARRDSVDMTGSGCVRGRRFWLIPLNSLDLLRQPNHFPRRKYLFCSTYVLRTPRNSSNKAHVLLPVPVFVPRSAGVFSREWKVLPAMGMNFINYCLKKHNQIGSDAPSLNLSLSPSHLSPSFTLPVTPSQKPRTLTGASYAVRSFPSSVPRPPS